jgi:hypothetical protein
MLNSKSIKKSVSDAEFELVKVTRHLQFGTIYGVEVKHEYRSMTAEVSIEESDLIDFAREHPYIDVLTVHAGQPVTAETDFVEKGFRCRKKHKFPTVRTEG